MPIVKTDPMDNPFKYGWVDYVDYNLITIILRKEGELDHQLSLCDPREDQKAKLPLGQIVKWDRSENELWIMQEDTTWEKM